MPATNADLPQHGVRRPLHPLIPDRQQRAVAKLHRGRITQVARRAVARDDDRFRPGAAVIFAHAGLVAQRSAAVTVGHQQPAVAEPQQVRGEPPDTDGMRRGPSLAPVGRLALPASRPSCACCGCESARRAGCRRSQRRAIRDRLADHRPAAWGSRPANATSAVVGRFTNAVPPAAPQLFAGVEQTPVGELDGPVRAVDPAVVGRGPGQPSVGGADHPHAQNRLALLFAEPVVSGLPPFQAIGRPSAGEPGGVFSAFFSSLT